MGQVAAAALALSAVAAVVGTTALAAPASRSTLRLSPVATISRSGEAVTLRGSFACTTRRFFALVAVAVEPTTGASAHGSIPLPGRRAPTCSPPRKSFRIVATQEGETKPRALKSSKLRVCFFIRSWGKGRPLSLDARCFTVRAAS